MVKKRAVRAPFVESRFDEVFSKADASRVRRAKMMVRQGDVFDVERGTGWISAKVRNGSFQGDIAIAKIPWFSSWTGHAVNVATWLARRPDWLATCLAGEYDVQFVEFIEQAGLSLFPNTEFINRLQWEAKCNCQDPEVLCRHILALLWSLILQMEGDPFFTFELLGIQQEELLSMVHEQGRKFEVKCEPKDGVISDAEQTSWAWETLESIAYEQPNNNFDTRSFVPVLRDEE